MAGRIVWTALVAAMTIAVSATAKAPKVGEPAPPFKITTLDGTRVSLADLRGQVVVLNFWATWCVPCRGELPMLDAYYRLQAKHGLKVFAVTTEDSVPLYRLKELTGAMAIPTVRNLRGPYEPMEGVPTNFVIDRAGVLRYAKAVAFGLDDLNGLLVPLLNEPGPGS